jgi:hypothetical protein
MSKFIVLWTNNHRLGSVDLTEKNMQEVGKQFKTRLIQKDFTGTVHLEILGLRRRKKGGKL